MGKKKTDTTVDHDRRELRRDARETASRKQRYIERVRAALTLTSDEVVDMAHNQYIDALVELSDDVRGMLEAARDEGR